MNVRRFPPAVPAPRTAAARGELPQRTAARPTACADAACAPGAAATGPGFALLAVLAVAAAIPAQVVDYTARNGGNLATCGPLGAGPIVHHTFLTTAPVADPISVADPGGGSTPASSAFAQFTSAATQTSLDVAVVGSASRGAPAGTVTALADGRDSWQLTILVPTRFALTAALAATSTETTVPPQHFAFTGGVITPDPGSPPPPYQHTLTTSGAFNLQANGLLAPGTYTFTLFGRAEGTTFPFSGSYAHALSLALFPAAAIVARAAPGNANSFTGNRPVLGQSWQASVDVGSTGHAFALVFAATAPAQIPLPNGLTVLLGGPVFELLPLAPGPLAAYTLPLPHTPALAGARLYTQALHVGGAPALLATNALDLTLGF